MLGLVRLKKMQDVWLFRNFYGSMPRSHLTWNLLIQSVSRGYRQKKKVHKAFVLSCQAFCLGSGGYLGSGYLGSSLCLIPSHGPSPYLSTYQGICLAPRALLTVTKTM